MTEGIPVQWRDDGTLGALYDLWHGTDNFGHKKESYVWPIHSHCLSLGNFEKYHIAAKFYPPFLLAKTCSFGNQMSLSQ